MYPIVFPFPEDPNFRHPYRIIPRPPCQHIVPPHHPLSSATLGPMQEPSPPPSNHPARPVRSAPSPHPATSASSKSTAALDLRLRHRSWTNIAEELSVSPTVAKDLVRQALLTIYGPDVRDQLITEWQLALARVDMVAEPLIDKALSGSLSAIDRWLALEKHRADIGGYRAPRRVELDMAVRSNDESPDNARERVRHKIAAMRERLEKGHGNGPASGEAITDASPGATPASPTTPTIPTAIPKQLALPAPANPSPFPSPASSSSPSAHPHNGEEATRLNSGDFLP